MPDIDLLALLRRHRPFTDLDEDRFLHEPAIDTQAPSRRYAAQLAGIERLLAQERAIDPGPEATASDAYILGLVWELQERAKARDRPAGPEEPRSPPVAPPGDAPLAPASVRPAMESDDHIREQAYLVARGVRPLALLDEEICTPLGQLALLTKLSTYALPGAIPFVERVRRGPILPANDAYCVVRGFAAARWVVDLVAWLGSADGVPEAQVSRIMGLLLGYSVEAIRVFEDEKPRGGQ